MVRTQPLKAVNLLHFDHPLAKLFLLEEEAHPIEDRTLLREDVLKDSSGEEVMDSDSEERVLVREHVLKNSDGEEATDSNSESSHFKIENLGIF